MTSNPNNPPEPQDQTSNNQSWNAIDLGLQPLNIFERIMKNFIKAFSFNFGWDYNNNIWRRLRTDDSGSLVVSTSTQNASVSATGQLTITPTAVKYFVANPTRLSFMIINPGLAIGGPSANVNLWLGDQTIVNQLIVPVGCAYFDDNYKGEIWLQAPGISTNQIIYALEYSE